MGDARTYRDDRSSLHCNRDQVMKVMVTSNIATDLDRGSTNLQTNAAARFLLTAVGVSLWSRKNRFKLQHEVIISLAADKHSHCPPPKLSLLPPVPSPSKLRLPCL